MYFLIFFGFVTADARGGADCSKQLKFAKKILRLEDKGERLRSHSKIQSMVSGLEDTVWDTAWVSKGYNITSCQRVGNEAVIAVNYNVVGSLESSTDGTPTFSKELRRQKVVFHVIQVQGRLKIKDLSRQRPYISVDAAVDSINETAQRNSFDPLFAKSANRAIADLKDAIEPERVPASELEQ
jgi:hypothetical protein